MLLGCSLRSLAEPPEGRPRVVILTHLWADKENLAIKTDYSTIIVDIAVGDGKTNIQEDAMAGFVFKNSGQHLYAM